MNLQSLLMEKWPYKVAAIVLSVLLWLNVTANQQTQDEGIQTRIEWEVRDSTWAISLAPEEVTTIFQGRSGDIIALFNAPVIRAVIETVEDSVVEVVLDVNDVEYDRSLNVIATSVSPPRVFVHLERRRTVMLPVMPMTEATAAPGHAIDRIAVRPDSVRVSGPESAVGGMVGIPTERLELGELAGSVTRLMSLQLPEGPARLDVFPSQVSVSIDVDSMVVRRFQVTVTVEGSGSDGVIVEPPSVVVAVRGGAQTVGSLSPMDLEAIVTIDGVPSGPVMETVRLRLPEAVNVEAESDRTEVRVSPRPTDTGAGSA